MSPLLVQLLFSLLIIVLAIGMMVYMYQYARRKMMQDRKQPLQNKPVREELKN